MATTCYADAPAEYFGGRTAAAHYLPYEEQEALQLDAAQRRFTALRNRIVPLKSLADAAKMDRIDRIEDVRLLLFPHSLFKSFPQHLLLDRRFDMLNEWISRLTTNDISAVAGRQFDAVDQWMEALDTETDLWIVHSSGTTGALSLYPRGQQEWALQGRNFRASMEEWMDPADAARESHDFAVIWPTYSGGRSAAFRFTDTMRDMLTSDPEQFYTLLPMPMSTDWQLWLIEADKARQRAAPPPEPSPYVQQKLDEASDAQNGIEERMRQLVERVRAGVGSRKVILSAGPINLHRLAAEGLRQGMEPGLPPGSIVRSFGGLKGMAEPESMERTILRFGGVERLLHSYGMTEITTHFNMCPHGRYHVPPWIVPMVIDPASGRLKPRKGRQKGLAAFMDLLPQTFWGGVVSADMVDMSWEGCACGRTTPSIEPTISRTPLPDGEAHMPSPASPEALHAALYALNRDIG